MMLKRASSPILIGRQLFLKRQTVQCICLTLEYILMNSYSNGREKANLNAINIANAFNKVSLVL